jgi:hypothetical protein
VPFHDHKISRYSTSGKYGSLFNLDALLRTIIGNHQRNFWDMKINITHPILGNKHLEVYIQNIETGKKNIQYTKLKQAVVQHFHSEASSQLKSPATQPETQDILSRRFNGLHWYTLAVDSCDGVGASRRLGHPGDDVAMSTDRHCGQGPRVPDTQSTTLVIGATWCKPITGPVSKRKP